MDLLGPLKTASDGKQYILVLTDTFSKWVELVALKDKSAFTVASAIFHTWICRYTAPKLLLSDNGKEFCNSLLKSINDFFNIHHIKTSIYHPQTNAASERYNRTLLNFLRAYVSESTLDWPDLLPVAQLSYNTQIHSSTRFSPYFLVHFTDPSLPFSRITEDNLSYATDWPAEALLRLNYVWRQSKANLVKACKAQKQYYDKLTTDRIFTPGQLVLWRRMTHKASENRKLLPAWVGPFVVISVPSQTNVNIRLTPHSKTKLVHTNDIKHYLSGTLYESETSGYPQDDSDIMDAPDEDNTDTHPKAKDSISSDDDVHEPEPSAPPLIDDTTDPSAPLPPSASSSQDLPPYSTPSDSTRGMTRPGTILHDMMTTRTTRSSKKKVPDIGLPTRPPEYKKYTKKK
jgi:hypothetical protein